MRSNLELQQEANLIKSEVNLILVLQQNNYSIDHQQSSGKSTILRDPDNHHKLSVSVSDKTGHWIFKDFKTSESGTVIDFFEKYQNSSKGEAFSKARGYLNQGIDTTTYNQIQQKPVSKAPKVSEDYFKFEKLTFTKYLNSRGISNETLDNSMFKNRIGQKKLPNSNFVSTVFPMYKNITGDISGLEPKNNGLPRTFPGSDKKNGFWRSDATGRNPDLVIVESPIDALSHYELNKNDNAFYISSNGELSKDRLNVLKNYIEPRSNQFNSLNLGMDNDAAGMRFNINIAGNIDLNNTNKNINVFVHAEGKNAVIEVNSTSENDIKEFRDKLNKLNNDLSLTSKYDSQYRNLKITENGNSGFQMKAHMYNFKDLYKPLFNEVKHIRNSEFDLVKIDGKDISADLETKKNIEVKVIQEINHTTDEKIYAKFYVNPEMKNAYDKEIKYFEERLDKIKIANEINNSKVLVKSKGIELPKSGKLANKVKESIEKGEDNEHEF